MKNVAGASMIVLGIVIAGGSGLMTFIEIYANGLLTSRSVSEQLTGGFLSIYPILGFFIGLLILAIGIVVRIWRTPNGR